MPLLAQLDPQRFNAQSLACALYDAQAIPAGIPLEVAVDLAQRVIERMVDRGMVR